ncbi:hypothetical protein [Enterococcus sp. DIV0187]|uniref:hypothetical protein n=1 Tax=Enterococcus sp. DIV0187 TaxID=2774644 RepID=UPI003F1EE6C3
MSEFSSFYLQVKIKKEDLDIAFSEKTNNIEDYLDWKEWFLMNQRMIGDPIKLLENFGYRFTDTINNRLDKMIAHVTYNEEQQLLILDNINIGSSFEVFMQYLIVFRGLAKYVIPKTVGNFMVIYPYWWGDREEVNNFANAYCEFVEEESYLKNEINAQNINTATEYFDAHADEFAREHYEKYGCF